MADKPLSFESERDKRAKADLTQAKEIRAKSIKSFFDLFRSMPRALGDIIHAHDMVRHAQYELDIGHFGRKLAKLNGSTKQAEEKIRALKAEYKTLTGKDLE